MNWEFLLGFVVAFAGLLAWFGRQIYVLGGHARDFKNSQQSLDRVELKVDAVAKDMARLEMQSGQTAEFVAKMMSDFPKQIAQNATDIVEMRARHQSLSDAFASQRRLQRQSWAKPGSGER